MAGLEEINNRVDVDSLYGLEVGRVKLADWCDNSEYPRSWNNNVKATKLFNDLVKVR